MRGRCFVPDGSQQRGDQLETDVLVIGSGIAGLSFVLDLLDRRPGLSVLLVSKDKLGEGNSRYAQGGIASVTLADDSIDSHVEDTLAAGDGLCLESAVREILDEAPRSMAKLIERGVEFDRQPDASYDLALEGGHSHRRIHHSGDRTGEAIIDTLVARVRERDEVRILERHTAVGLIRRTGRHSPGSTSEVRGAYLLEGNAGPIHSVTARATVLATGGAGKVYRYTSNSELSTGDGVAMCYRSGARVGNLEFYQFHPTLLYHPEVNNFLITEAIRGEGAYLCLPDGERFMARHQPEKMELATRDKVVRAIFTEMERGTYDHVCLDVRHLDPAKLRAHFPLIVSTLAQLGIDVGKRMIPTVPAAHYMCGGVLTDTAGRTDLGRLFVIGESAFTGLHGANRLASNSLIEGVVMASLASVACDDWIDQPLTGPTSTLGWDSPSHIDDRRGSQLNAHWRGLRNEMTSFAGIVRTEAGLRDLLTIIGTRREMIEEYYWTHWVTRDLVELRDIALVAELIARSALHRRESRGGHFREDYPLPVPDTQDTILRFQEEFPIQSNLFERPRA